MEHNENPGQELHDMEEHAVPQAEALAEMLRDASRRAVQFVRARPGACLLGALAAGFLVGRLVRTRG